MGVANIERFNTQPPYFDAPPVGFGPRDYIPEAKSVISVAQPILNSVMDSPAAIADKDVEMLPLDNIHEYFELLYNTVGHRTQDFLLEHIVQVVGQYFLAQGFRVMTFPTTSIHPVHAHGLDLAQTFEGPSEEWAKRYLTHASRSQLFRYH